MNTFVAALALLSSFTTSVLAIPAGVENRQSTCSGADCIPGYKLSKYHVVYDFINAPDGTPISNLQGLEYTGFYVSGRQNGFNPYPQPQANRTPKFAVAEHARDKDLNALPTMTVRDLGQGQSLFKLKTFYWAVMPYLSENVTLDVQCYNPSPKKPSELVYTGKKATFVYNTGYNVGANGAQVQEAVMPTNFVCNTYKLNVTKPVDGSNSPIPTLFIDELQEITYYPSN